MFKKVVPITKEKHLSKKIKPITSFAFAADLHLAYIMGAEFLRAASTYPIVFLEDAKNDEFRPVALLGLKAGENLFVDDKGRWEASYIPAVLRGYPFILGRTPEKDRFTVCIDEESEFLNEEEGQAMFDDEGEPSQVLENVKKYLAGLQQMEQLTQQFCREFKEKNMFVPLNMKVRQEDSLQNITGAYAINEQRLDNLSDEVFLDLRKRKILPMIYCHLASLTQIERLVKLRNKSMVQPAPSIDDADALEE